MTTNGRPNLGGLFTGSTPPERSSTIADALDSRTGAPRTARSTPADTAGPPTAPRQTPARAIPAPPISTPSVAAPVATPAAGQAAWWDPVNALGYYFDFLQGLFDANRAVTMAVATAVTAPLRRSRPR
ncbi:hypothetical protein ACVBEQ_08645 [Nakamurella sp. GG22]